MVRTRGPVLRLPFRLLLRTLDDGRFPSVDSPVMRSETPRPRALPLLLLALVTLVIGACDSSDPVAPPGTVLSISATPTRIAADSSSRIRVVAQKPNGTPVNPGTLIRFSTTVGDIAPTVGTDDNGEVINLLLGNGEFGTATVTATAGTSESVSIDVQVGLSAGSITLQADPSSVPETGGTVDLLAIVRDDQGQPLSNAQVNFKTDTGSLESGGSLLSTAEDGSARDSLRVTEGDLNVVQGDTFQVSVEVGGGGGNLISTSESVTIQRRPVADFTFATSNLTVVFTDTSTGDPRTWRWDFGDENTSQLQNPSHTYSEPGTYVVTLTAINSQGEDTISKVLSVSGQ